MVLAVKVILFGIMAKGNPCEIPLIPACHTVMVSLGRYAFNVLIILVVRHKINRKIATRINNHPEIKKQNGLFESTDKHGHILIV